MNCGRAKADHFIGYIYSRRRATYSFGPIPIRPNLGPSTVHFGAYRKR